MVKARFEEAAKKYPNSSDAIMAVFKILNKNDFDTPEVLKNVFPSLDNFKYKDGMYIIDIGGNTLRLMAVIRFQYKKIFVQHIVTHAEYDKLCQRYKKGELS